MGRAGYGATTLDALKLNRAMTPHEPRDPFETPLALRIAGVCLYGALACHIVAMVLRVLVLINSWSPS